MKNEIISCFFVGASFLTLEQLAHEPPAPIVPEMLSSSRAIVRFPTTYEETPVNKGDRIKASWFVARLGSLAGNQAKFPAQRHQLTGTIRHIRGDKPADPAEIRIYVDADPNDSILHTVDIGCSCGHEHVELKPEWIDEVLQ